MKKSRGLGRGLDALLPSTPAPQAKRSAQPAEAQTEEPGNVFSCLLTKIAPQPGQPRQHFDQAKLDELVASIKEHGLLEPLVVRKKGDDQYELIAGERRYRALKLAGMKEALVVVHEVSPLLAFELAIIENVQREDLDVIELAEALDRLVREYGYTQDKLAERIGKSRSAIANSLRLLKLPEGLRDKVVTGELSEGHARALLGLPDKVRMIEIGDEVLRRQLSVRQTEELVRGAKKKKEPQKKPEKTKAGSGKSASVRDLEKRLERRLGSPCDVQDKGGAGSITIQYGSLDELDRILDLIM
ncbi:MAG: ParB/RepB/Spo0J family partition protein [Polyangiaceae bacterium]|nr:ParB/RepB/Spo0J family partition protein [Polyangiaceae bacterium]